MVYTYGLQYSKVCHEEVSNCLFCGFVIIQEKKKKQTSEFATEISSYIRKTVFKRVAKW